MKSKTRSLPKISVPKPENYLMMLVIAAKAAFSAELNQVVGPVETEFGWHFILVTKKESVPFVKYQDIVRFLKPLTPESGYVPVLHIGNKIHDIKPQVKSTPTEETTGSGSTTETKDYRLVITFNNEGRQMLLY